MPVTLAGLGDAIADAAVQTVYLLLQLLAMGGVGTGGELGQADKLGAKLLHGIVKGLPLIVELGTRHTRWAGVLVELDGDFARFEEEAAAGELLAVEIGTAEQRGIGGAGKLKGAAANDGLAKNLLWRVFECQGYGVAILQLGSATLDLINIRLAGAKHEACNCQSDKTFTGHYTMYKSLMLLLSITRWMASANISATLSCLTFAQRWV